jgi:hypothetical protein
MNWPFDWYSFRAQLAPALISTFPALVLGATLVSWDRFKLADGLALLATTVLLFALAFFARDRGIHVQPLIFPDGLPSLQWVRHRNDTLDSSHKKRVLDFLCSKIAVHPPTADYERLDAQAADLVYARAIRWLRDSTRTAPFKLLLNENATYGFYRNMYGMKKVGLTVSALTVLVIGTFSLYRYSQDSYYDFSTFFLILGVAVIHAVYLLVAITEDAVKRASMAYARELFGAADFLMSSSISEPQSYGNPPMTERGG